MINVLKPSHALPSMGARIKERQGMIDFVQTPVQWMIIEHPDKKPLRPLHLSVP